MRKDVREIFTGSVCLFFGYLVTRWSVDPQSSARANFMRQFLFAHVDELIWPICFD